MADTYSIGEVAARTDMLTVVCSRCERRGRLSMRRLVAEYGSDVSLSVVLREISADCPKRQASGWMERCDPHCPELPELFMG